MAAGLLIAGKIDPALRPEIESAAATSVAAGKPVVIVDRILSDIELDAAVAAVNCLMLAHSNEGPSGLLGKAACCGTRVIAAGAKSLKSDIEDMPRLGDWTELNEESLGAAMQESLPLRRGQAVLNSDVNSFVRVMLPND
ncbi:hypothetical protein [Paenarthrobacter nitroguajacolicus]|uniref:hypothetical protein n=1 Tax=Paenarthrobacter nitroguajacolicus TaxID=211146 RepID=UPI0040540715